MNLQVGFRGLVPELNVLDPRTLREGYVCLKVFVGTWWFKGSSKQVVCGMFSWYLNCKETEMSQLDFVE